MSEGGPYVIDSDVFIQAKNQYYAFAICPGFWDSLIGHFKAAKVSSIDRIRDELLRGGKDDDLVQWVKQELPGDFFHTTQDRDVVDLYGEMMLWVQRNPQFFDYAKAKFATEADAWLAAYAKVNGCVVITGEVYRPDVKSRVPLPNVCREFGVECGEVFPMLRDLDVRFHWEG